MEQFLIDGTLPLHYAKFIKKLIENNKVELDFNEIKCQKMLSFIVDKVINRQVILKFSASKETHREFIEISSKL